MPESSSKFAIHRPADLHGVEVLHAAIDESFSMRHMHEDYRFGTAVGERCADSVQDRPFRPARS